MKARPKILVVDSDKNILAAFRISLAGGGYRPVVCSNPEDAMSKLRLTPIDIVVTELHLNGFVDLGLAFLTALRDTLPHLPIIVMGDQLDAPLEKRLESLQIDAFFSKPIELRSLKRKIKSLLEVRQRKAARYSQEKRVSRKKHNLPDP